MATKKWTSVEEKMFELSLAIYSERSQNRWTNIAWLLNKSVDEVKEHYKACYFDILMNVYGLDDVPGSTNIPVVGLDSTNPIYLSSKQGAMDIPSTTQDLSNSISLGSKQEDNKQKRRNFWSDDEHRLFLIGLERYGKGDWRSISRNVVVTRTATQVASHAQKYFNRQKLGKSEKKRSSIHNITIEDTNLATPLNSTRQLETLIAEFLTSN